MRRKTATQFLWALCLIAVGVILLLVNLNFISFELKRIYLFVYPFVLALYGLYLFFKSFSYHSSGNLFWGLFITTLSGFLIADRFNMIEFGFWDFWKLWPVIFIFMALNMLFFKKKIIDIEIDRNSYWIDDEEDDDWIETDNQGEDKRQEKKKESQITIDIDMDQIFKTINENISDEETREKVKKQLEKYQSRKKHGKVKVNFRHDDSEKYMNFHKENGKKNKTTDINVFGISISEKEFKDPNWLLEPMKLSSVIVDYYFDFSKAFIQEGTTPVKVKGKVGQIIMLIPEDLPIKLHVKNSIGNVSVFGKDLTNTGSGRTYTYVSPNYEEATRKLNLDIKLSIGSIEIVQV